MSSIRRKKSKRSYYKNVTESPTMFGGKPFPSWQTHDFKLPGYQNCRLIFKNRKTQEIQSWGFLMSPSTLTMQKSNDVQTNKTMAGWFISRGGPALGSLSLGGYFLDTLYAPERMRFLEMYANLIEDQQDKYMDFVSDYSQIILIEGNYYYGVLQSINLTKSSNQQFMYQYTMNFLFYKTTSAYNISSSSMSVREMKDQMGLNKTIDSSPQSSEDIQVLASGVANILTSVATGNIMTTVSSLLSETSSLSSAAKAAYRLSNILSIK